MAAYNEDAVYYLHDEARGLRQLQFATPELDIHYAGTDSEEEVEAIDIIGFRAHDRLLNSAYDEGTMTIVSHAKWRGPADASDSGRWLFRNGHFTLVRYEVDASYDGEVNPETVLDGARLRNPAMSRSLQRSRISASTSSTVWTRQ